MSTVASQILDEVKSEVGAKFSEFETYKDSGATWIPRVPSHWDIKRLRFAVGFPKKSESKSVPSDTLVSFIPMEAVGEFGGIDLAATKPLEDVIDGYTYFADGDVVVAKITPCFENGKGAIASGLKNGIGFGTTELYVLRPEAELDNKYLFYVTISGDFRSLGAGEMYGAGGQKRVPEDFIRELRHPIPPIQEQRAIASFLDRETSKIDALVKKKERLIELLAEKRTALISHAVTKGLTPDAPMKECGNAWFPQIPSHWIVKPLKFVSSIGNGSTPKRDNRIYWDDGYFPWLNSAVVNQDSVTSSTQFVTQEALDECHLPIVQPPAILVGITGQGKTRGMATMLKIKATINQHVAYIKPRGDAIDASFLLLFFEFAYRHLRSDSEGGGSTKGAITCEQLGSCRVPCPPLEEQYEIVEKVNSDTTRMNRLIDRIEKAIDRLREYRTALISAAVTGKIDVRDHTTEDAA